MWSARLCFPASITKLRTAFFFWDITSLPIKHYWLWIYGITKRCNLPFCTKNGDDQFEKKTVALNSHNVMITLCSKCRKSYWKTKSCPSFPLIDFSRNSPAGCVRGNTVTKFFSSCFLILHFLCFEIRIVFAMMFMLKWFTNNCWPVCSHVVTVVCRQRPNNLLHGFWYLKVNTLISL